jgi:outer membrane protein assembly factor BamD
MTNARLTSALAACMVALLSACSSGPSANDVNNMSPNRLYAEAKDELNSGAYDRAIRLFERLEGRAAGTILAQQAQLDLAYAQYRVGDKALAIATIERFQRTYPLHPASDYALYLRGVISFNDNLGFLGSWAQVDLSERDQRAAKESFGAFKQLVERFPESRYAADSRLRMGYIINSLAEYEVHVARYYLSRGAYVAAINRAQQSMIDYQNAPANEEGLSILARAYDALKMPELRDDALRVLKLNFPNSPWLTGGPPAARSWWQIF